MVVDGKWRKGPCFLADFEGETESKLTSGAAIGTEPDAGARPALDAEVVGHVFLLFLTRKK